MMGYGWGGWYGGLWMIGGLLVIIGIVLLVVWLTNTGRDRASPGAPRRSTAHEILRERFARGEITEEEYRRAVEVLGPDR